MEWVGSLDKISQINSDNLPNYPKDWEGDSYNTLANNDYWDNVIDETEICDMFSDLEDASPAYTNLTAMSLGFDFVYTILLLLLIISEDDGTKWKEILYICNFTLVVLGAWC